MQNYGMQDTIPHMMISDVYAAADIYNVTLDASALYLIIDASALYLIKLICFSRENFLKFFFFNTFFFFMEIS